MILKTGDMFKAKVDVLFVTTNAFVRGDGCLVMGRGAAYQMTQLYPWTHKTFGKLVTGWAVRYPNQPYGILVAAEVPCKPVLGIFQVKHHFRDEASPDLIINSVHQLSIWATHSPLTRFAVNFPGIGNGRLRRKDVLPLLQPLPDNVEVWELE